MVLFLRLSSYSVAFSTDSTRCSEDRRNGRVSPPGQAEESTLLLIDMDDKWLASNPSQSDVSERQNIPVMGGVKNEPSATGLTRVERQDPYHLESDSKTAMNEISREDSSIGDMRSDDCE
jgi:hypothetical protein